MLDPALPHRASTTLALAGSLGVFAVALGAFGAHALAPRLGAQGQQTWHTAVFYHAVHAVALLALAALQAAVPALRGLATAAWAFFVGVILFSGSLYALALGGPRSLGPVTPLGGLCLLVGWGCVAVAGLWRH